MSGPDRVGPVRYRPMRARRPDEPHRTSTPLELLFDLCFVVAVARAGIGLEHGVLAGHAGMAITYYLMTFFAVWWAWVNFTWFASQFDTDDVAYRVAVLVQIAGSLVLAAGVSKAVAGGDFSEITWGYVVIRVASVAQWLRAAQSNPEDRSTALRFAAGILLVQLGWVAGRAVPQSGRVLFLVLVTAELLVPVVAERGGGSRYHPEHIAERYGLFTVIVLGEAVTAAANAVGTGLDRGENGTRIVVLAAMGLLVLFSLWWLYFDQPVSRRLESFGPSLLWGYGHYFVFTAIAAIGVGVGLSVSALAPPGAEGERVGSTAASAFVTVPVAVFLLVKLMLHDREDGAAQGRLMRPATAVGAVVILSGTVTPVAVGLTALVTVLLVVLLVLTKAEPDAGTGED